MSQEIVLNPGESIIAQLVEPDEFIHHRNQVAAVTNQRIVFLRKRILGAYYEIEYIPLSECASIRYSRRLAIGSMIGGGLLMLIGLAVFVLAVSGELRNFSVVLYGVPLLGIGSALFFGVKRHVVFFDCRMRTVKWISGAGKFRERKESVQNLIAVAKSMEIWIGGLDVYENS